MDDDMVDVTISGWWAALSLFTRIALLLTLTLVIGIIMNASGASAPTLERFLPFGVPTGQGAARVFSAIGFFALITWLLAFGINARLQRKAKVIVLGCLALIVLLIPIRMTGLL